MGWGNSPYARNGFANAHGDRVFGQSGIYDVWTGAFPYPNAPAASGFQQSFDPIDPDIYYFHSGSELRSYDLGTGQEALVRDFGVPLEHLGGSVDWIDRTGRYMVVNLAGNVRVYDKAADQLFTGTVPASLVTHGWVGISPDARWLVAAEVEHRAFPIDLAAGTLSTQGHVFWTLCGDHGDLVSASDGKTYMVTPECWSFPHVYAVDISLTQSGDTAAGRQKQRDDNHMLFAMTWDEDAHFSGISTGWLRDWAFVSTEHNGPNESDPNGTWYPYKNEIVMVNVLTGEVRRLAHHRSDSIGYCSSPRVQVAWDGSGVFYASNYGDDTSGCDYSDLYFVHLY